MILALTGHRPDKLGGYGPSPVQDHVRELLRRFYRHYTPRAVISGMALGFDQWGAEEAFDLGVPVCAAVPFEGQEAKWPAESKVRYRSLLSLCYAVVPICAPGYAAWKMQTRNEWMVDNCTDLLACWDGSDGGTANCVRYAQKVGRSVFRL